MSSNPGIYVHVPYCSAICPYCDFAVRVDRGNARRHFVDHVLRELDGLRTGPQPPGDDLRRLVRGDLGAFDTIYLGGGTPSLLSADDLERLVGGLERHLPVTPAPRLFVEANPEDVTEEAAAAWRRLGVWMLSLGIQSFADEELRFLGRRHTTDEARRAVEIALGAGFPTVSVDLIYGLPGQQPDAWRRQLDIAAGLGPHHLSCYELEVHERTTFGKRRARGTLREMPEDAQADLFLFTHRHLATLGYDGYEVSNFAREQDHRSTHNAKYWHHVPYLGLGPSAHSHAGSSRWWNVRQAPTWQRRLAAGDSVIDGHEILGPRDLAFESVMLGLRTTHGVDPDLVQERWGTDLRTPNAARVVTWQQDGLIEMRDGRWVPTVRGMAVADRLASELVI